MNHVEFYTMIYFLIGGLKLVLTQLMSTKAKKEEITKTLDDVEVKLGSKGRSLTLLLSIIVTVVTWPLDLAMDVRDHFKGGK